MWTRMSFGHKNAPSTFQRAMHCIFTSLELHCLRCGVRVYLEDVLICAPTFNEFVQLVGSVLHLLSLSGLMGSLDKCKFALQAIKFLGFIPSKNGKQPDPAMVDAILRIPRLTNSKAVLYWLQTANLYCRFFKQFSRFAAPLQCRNLFGLTLATKLSRGSARH